MAENYYDILGVSKGASDDEIKKAYRKAAHQHHPDKSGGDEARFKKVNEAYQVLSDKSKRAQYDQFGQTFNGGQSGPAGGGQGGFGGFDFSGFSSGGGPASGWDFGQSGGGASGNFDGVDFEDIFSNIFGGGGSSRSTRSRQAGRGQDIQVDLEITFAEMVTGVRKKVRLYKNAACDHCQGTGGEPGASVKTCPTCKGSGQVHKITRSFLGSFSQVSVCSECEGRGQIYEKKCSVCRGDGRVKKEEDIEIAVPAGIESGQTISLRGAGEAGARGGAAGDLYILVRVAMHKKFTRQGLDILSTEEISFSLAALGGEIEIETIEGNLILKIPSGTQSGETFRVRGRGVPELHGRGRGNHLVKIIVRIPKRLSREQKRLIEELKNSGE